MASASGCPVAHLVYELIGAGKSTYAKHLEGATGGVRFGLDEWMLRLHYLGGPLETALERSAKRSLDQTPDSHRVKAEDVRHLAEIFERPSADEGLLITEVQVRRPAVVDRDMGPGSMGRVAPAANPAV